MYSEPLLFPQQAGPNICLHEQTTDIGQGYDSLKPFQPSMVCAFRSWHLLIIVITTLSILIAPDKRPDS